jgi:6-phosphofructokinase 2
MTAATPPRLVTLTVNPSLDIACTTQKIYPIRKVHTGGEHFDPGGGGVNVARVVHALGGDVLAILLAGSATGELVCDLLRQQGVPYQKVPIAGLTRIDLTVIEQPGEGPGSGVEYRFVASGPTVSPAECRAALDLLETVQGDWLIASGSLPPGAPEDFYVQAARIAQRRGMRFALDTSGHALAATRAARLGDGLELLKPSLGELEKLLGRELTMPQAQEEGALQLLREGAARMVALTLGWKGAVLAAPEGVWRLRSPDIEVHSAVGAGDSFLAAMAYSLARGEAPDMALAWGIAAGTAATAGIGTARIKRADVEAHFRDLPLPEFRRLEEPRDEPGGAGAVGVVLGTELGAE